MLSTSHIVQFSCLCYFVTVIFPDHQLDTLQTSPNGHNFLKVKHNHEPVKVNNTDVRIVHRHVYVVKATANGRAGTMSVDNDKRDVLLPQTLTHSCQSAWCLYILFTLHASLIRCIITSTYMYISRGGSPTSMSEPRRSVAQVLVLRGRLGKEEGRLTITYNNCNITIVKHRRKTIIQSTIT